MTRLSPQPRYRIYTGARHYARVFGDPVLGRWTHGDECQRLEGEVTRRFDTGHGVCMPQARVGIYYAIRTLVKPGQAVILSPYTIADVVNMVICAGARPIFCDIDRRTCNIDAAGIESLMDRDTGAVMVTHLHGLACDLEPIVDLCRRRGVPLIEDAAQAFGTLYKGKRCGTFGTVGVYSFGLYKNVTAIFGGMVVSRDKNVVETIYQDIDQRPYFELSRIWKKAVNALATDISTMPGIFQTTVYPLFRLGHLRRVAAINRFVETELDLSRKNELPESYLRRMTPLQARLALSRIDRVDADTNIRIENARLYDVGLRDVKELILPPLREDGSHIYTYYPVQAPNRDRLLRHLMERHRDVGRQHLKNTADLQGFDDFHRDCPNARATADSCILLPSYPRYGASEVDRTIRAVREFYGR